MLLSAYVLAVFIFLPCGFANVVTQYLPSTNDSLHHDWSVIRRGNGDSSTELKDPLADTSAGVDDKTWNEFFCKGQKHIENMLKSAKEVPQSPFQVRWKHSLLERKRLLTVSRISQIWANSAGIHHPYTAKSNKATNPTRTR